MTKKQSATQAALAFRTKTLEKKANILSGSTVYLSGPMDFVASRREEKELGWRNRVGQFLRGYGVTVYDPWYKPLAKGLGDYGREDEFTTEKRGNWTYDDSPEGDRVRAELCSEFWPTLHIDLRMTDTADFLVAFVPTNIYSVGTVHEIVMARLQHKPVLFVSPPVTFRAYDSLVAHLQDKGDAEGEALLEQLAQEAPLRPNTSATPSMWNMALIDGHYFFDGFGFEKYREKFGWKTLSALDQHEREFPPRRPLLPYLESLNRKIPKRYDIEHDDYVENPEWLIFDDDDL
ncbi:MAG: nucleoside 2-deoxyribosyltransferase domain-containing protein [Gammaproteobacteria bacterium]|jgi:hypothetical protein|nr:nucleoside 2-deoxyribosyltransferase domain-containing protein [Gammaproteobacteria bacterium]